MDVPPLHTQQLPSPLQGLKSGAALSEWYLPRRDWNLFHDPSYVERLNVLLQSCQEEVRIHSAKGGDQHKARELRENAIPLLEKLLHLANKPPDMLLVLLRVPEEHWKVPAKSSAAVSPVSSRRLGRGPSRNSAGIQAASSAHDAGDEMHEEMMSPTGAGRFNTSGGSTSSTAAHHQEHHHHHPSDLERQNNEPLLFYVHREIFAALNPVIKSEIKLWDRLEELHLKYGAGCERVCRMLYGEAWEKWVNYAYQSKAFDTKDDDGRSSFRSVSRSLHVDVREGVGDDLPSSDNILVDKNGAPGQITKGSTLYAASTEHDDDSHRGSPADDGFDRDTARDEDPASSTINNTSSVVIGKRHHHRHHVKQEQLDFVPSGKVDLTELAHEDRSGRGVKPTAQAVIDKQLAQLRRLHRCVIRGTQTRLGELFYKRVVVQSGPARIRSRLTARGVEHALHYLYNRGATRDSASGESWDHIPSDDFPSALHFLFQLAVTEKTMLEALRALLYQRPQIGCLYLARQYGYDKTRTRTEEFGVFEPRERYSIRFWIVLR
ncbi:unnamed protein product [Amoebophrya sp. A25]|nr:unnamed protein product [Amoebophrya sp. A25]|eukprot:GSA25T00012166001.1